MKHNPQPHQPSLHDDYFFRQLVPPDHELLQIDQAVDFTFVQISSPATCPVHWDSNSTATYCEGWWVANYVGNRHNDGCNISFADGHAKWMSKLSALGTISYTP